jgi:hypothetical protein
MPVGQSPLPLLFEPTVPVLHIDGFPRWWERRIGKRAHGDCDRVWFATWLPIYIRTAMWAEVERDRVPTI